MKKIIALLLVAVMAIGFCACAAKTETPAEPATTETTTTEATETTETTEPAAEETTTEETTENQHFDKLTLEFVPSKDADVIITGTKNLPELVKAEMSKLGYDIDEVDITVGTSYDATGEAMAAGSIDLGWLPGGTYALYSDDVDVILTATRNGLSNDSTNPADWNGEANATKKDGPQVTYYRSLIYATPSAYGQELAAKVNAGEKLTWEDLDKATWAVQKTSSSAGYIYPSMWLMANYDGKKISDLSNVMPIDSGYGTAFSRRDTRATPRKTRPLRISSASTRSSAAPWRRNAPIGRPPRPPCAGATVGRRKRTFCRCATPASRRCARLRAAGARCG